jgi:hypothetical protein
MDQQVVRLVLLHARCKSEAVFVQDWRRTRGTLY